MRSVCKRKAGYSRLISNVLNGPLRYQEEKGINKKSKSGMLKEKFKPNNILGTFTDKKYVKKSNGMHKL